MRRKKGWIALASYLASPQGRRRLRRIQQRLDTPANRQRVVTMKDKVLTQRRPKR